MNTNSLTSLCTQLQLEVSYYRFHSIPLCFWCWSMKSQTHTHTLCILSNFWLYEWGISGGFWLWRIAAEPEGVCDVCYGEQTDLRAAVHCERTAWTGGRALHSENTHTHTELPPGTSAVLQVYYCSRLLMISHPLRIEVTETLIQDSLIIASGYFYLSLNIRGAFTSPKLCLCSCFFLFLLCFHLNLYLSLCREASRDTLQK